MTTASFNASSTTDDVLAGVDLSGRVAVVTGASSGLGLESCRALSAAGAEVVMVARREQPLQAARQTILDAQPSAKLSTLLLDLADLDSVRSAAETLLARCDRIDLLINNAGLMACAEGRSVQGFELQFATNHLGHFLFSCLLVPALLKAQAPRVVTLSSGGHKYAPVDFDDVNYQRKPYDKWLAYGQAKTANALFAVGLAKRLGDRGLRSFAVHPGAIATDLGRHLSDEDIKQMMAEAASSGVRLRYKSIAQGAATSLWAATSPALAELNGLYLEDCGIGREVEVGNVEGGYLAYAQEDAAAEQLWTLSEQLLGQAFSF